MNLQKAIISARNDLAFKIYDAGDSIRDKVAQTLSFKEERIFRKIRNTLPFPSTIVRNVASIVHMIADKTCIICEVCEAAPCSCYKEQESFSEEDYHASYHEACLTKDDEDNEGCHDGEPCSCYFCKSFQHMGQEDSLDEENGDEDLYDCTCDDCKFSCKDCCNIPCSCYSCDLCNQKVCVCK